MARKPKDKPRESERQLSRRGFITSVGVGAVAAAAVPAVSAERPAAGASLPAGEPSRITLQVNGRRHRLLVEPRWSLLYVLRERIGLTGAKAGCERGECGACTVLIDGLPRYACMTLAVEAEGKPITTVEGLMDGEQLGPVQQAFMEHDALQCGYCTPGQVVAVEGLLRANPDPGRDAIRAGLSGNLCRCGAYYHIVEAARSAADKRRAHKRSATPASGK
jgi:xanthine dehydrogenase YagT iron-sulfur-binding subunit